MENAENNIAPPEVAVLIFIQGYTARGRLHPVSYEQIESALENIADAEQINVALDALLSSGQISRAVDRPSYPRRHKGTIYYEAVRGSSSEAAEPVQGELFL